MSKVGEYVRTKYGIAKVISTKVKDEDDNNVLQVDKMLEPYFCDGCDRFLCDPKDVIKSRTDIIDLIEENDIIKIHEFYDVYGVYEVQEFKNPYTNEKYLGVKTDNGKPKRLHQLKIVSIVTKEQFESMQYKVGENQC